MSAELKVHTIEGVECVVVAMRSDEQLRAVAEFAAEMAPELPALRVCRLCPVAATKRGPTLCTPCPADELNGERAAVFIPLHLYHILKLRLPS